MADPVNGYYEIPLVFHILHTGQALGTAANPTDAQVQGYVDRLNSTFANTFDNTSTPGTFNSVNVQVRFALAKHDQAGNNFSGVFHYNLSGNSNYIANGVGAPGISDEDMVTQSGYQDGQSFFNVYIINMIDGNNSGIAGSAGVPDADGFSGFRNVKVIANEIAKPNATILTHEIGHSLGLHHTFDGGSNSNCPPSTGDCLVDNDGICDTDPLRNGIGCNPTGTNPCTEVEWAFSTVQYNYMTYSCVDRFTPNQATKMYDIFNIVNASYKNSSATLPYTGPATTVIAPPTKDAAFPSNSNYGPRYVNINTLEVLSHGYQFENQGGVHYIDHTYTQQTTLIPNGTYPITIGVRGNLRHNVRVYLDYNNNGAFDEATETIFSHNMTSTEVGTPDYIYMITGNFTVPQTGITTNIPLRLRVIADHSTSVITPDAPLLRGQAEDYTVIISGALPVTFGTINGSIKNNTLNINWTTLSEKNIDYFEIQTAADGKNFKTVGTVKSKSADGNSNTQLSYQFTQNASGPSALFISLLSLSGVLMLVIKNRKKQLGVGALVALIALNIWSCKKHEVVQENSTKSIYVRILQVDKDGVKTEIKTFKADQK